MFKSMTAISLAVALAGCSTFSGLMGGQAEHHEGMESSAHHEGAHYEGMDHAAMYAAHHADDIAAAINAEDRPDGDQNRDAVRHPDVTLTFSQIEPGSRVLDLGAGAGYYTLLLSGLVGPEGHVTGQSPQDFIDRFGASWPERHAAMAQGRGNIDFVVREFDDLGFAPESFDAIAFMLTYHDAALAHEDRTEMNAGFFEVLRPGGLFLLSDNSAPDGSGTETTQAIHRIDQALVIAELEAAGFELIAETDALRNPEDDRSIYVWDPAINGFQDKFVMLFRRP